MRVISVRSLGTMLTAGMTACAFSTYPQFNDSSTDESPLLSPSTGFQIGRVAVQHPTTPDLTGDYKLPGFRGSSAVLSIVQDQTGNLVGTAKLNVGGRSYTPIELNGQLSTGAPNTRFTMGGELRSRIRTAENSPQVSEKVDLDIHGYQTGSSFAVFVNVAVQGQKNFRSRFVGNISPATQDTTCTLVFADTQSYQDDYGVHYRSEREVTQQGASLGTANAAQINYRNFVLFQAQTENQMGHPLKLKLYGFVNRSSFNVVMARLETPTGRSILPPESVLVRPSLFAANTDSSEDRNDDIITLTGN
jgi:hypothetical protein